MRVLFSPEVRQYFRELEYVLYEKEYFGFEDSAIKYVRELIFEIRNDLPKSVMRQAPAYFERYGNGLYYAVFRKSKSTRWYAFFSTYEYQGEIIYLVRYISNNHVIAQYL